MMFYLIVILFLFLTFLLVKKIIDLWYKSKLARYSIDNNYLSRIALFLIYSAFCLVNPPISENIINWLINVINKKYDLRLPQFSMDLDIYSVIIFSVFVIAVGYILHKSYQARFLQFKKESELPLEIIQEKKIQYPKNDWFENPNFLNRIKKLFELKFKKEGLKLRISNSDKMLYGSYKDGFREYYIIINCEDGFENIELEDNKIREKLNDFKLFDKSINEEEKRGENCIVDYYFCPRFSTIQTNFSGFRIISETELINSLIDFKPYLDGIIDSFKKEKLFSAVSNNQKNKTLYETFINPNYQLQDNKESNHELDWYINDWLKNCPDQKHLVLLGDYGMGKTSFLKYYTKQLAELNLKDANSRIPVYLSLTNCSPRHGGIERLVKSFVAENLGVDYERFEYLVHKGKILFLLDGFDEMGFIGTHDDRFKQMNEIWQLALKNNKIIIAGRSSYFPSEFELKQSLNIIEQGREIIQTEPYCESILITPLGDDKIKGYIRAYYPDKVELYFDWIKKSPSLYELCSRPSLMHIIREMLPKLIEESQESVYTQGVAIDKYIEYWINRQESKKIQSAFPKNPKDKVKFIRAFYQFLAVSLFINDQYEITFDDVKTKLNEMIINSPKLKFKDLTHKEGFENEIFTGYFIERKDSFFQFVHKSFFEFFVSQEIIQDLKERKYNEPVIYKDWSNSIVDFIYDTIKSNQKYNSDVPILMQIKNHPVKAKIKSSIFKFFFLQGDFIVALILSSSIIYLSFIFFRKLNYHWFSMIILYVLFLILTIAILAFIINIIYKITDHRKLKFILKAYKIAFVKRQFLVVNNLAFVNKLNLDNTPPMIPIENISIDNYKFLDDSLYRFKNVQLNGCVFLQEKISNCHFDKVLFSSVKFNPIVFDHVRFSSIEFQNCKMNNSAHKISPDILKINHLKDVKMYFLNCRFDKKSLVQIYNFASQNDFTIGKEISGNEEFLKKIYLIEKQNS